MCPHCDQFPGGLAVEITEEYLVSDKRSFEIQDGDLHITITGPSAQFFGSDLYTQAVVALIQEADTDGWEKHQLNRGGSFGEAADQFYAAIFGAVARHAAVSGIDAEGMTVAAVLRAVIDDLVAKGRLTTTISDGGEHDPEDER